MRAIFAGWVLATALTAQTSTKPVDSKPADSKPDSKQTTKPAPKQVEEPPEEDESLIPKECVLNPLEAEHNIKTGDFYFKKAKLGAARNRYKEATCWDPSSGLAFLKLGEAEEKLHNRSEAREAYEKYLTIVPDAKNAAEIKKKIAKLPAPKS
jgi:tetratricopeptide (TPR) repeat protein